jgi:hypothetical protein
LATSKHVRSGRRLRKWRDNATRTISEGEWPVVDDSASRACFSSPGRRKVTRESGMDSCYHVVGHVPNSVRQQGSGCPTFQLRLFTSKINSKLPTFTK